MPFYEYILMFYFVGSGIVNSCSNNRERGTMGNIGAKCASASTNSGTLSEITSSHQEVIRTSSSSAALISVNNADSLTKHNYYQSQNHQKSTGASSITSDSITGK